MGITSTPGSTPAPTSDELMKMSETELFAAGYEKVAEGVRKLVDAMSQFDVRPEAIFARAGIPLTVEWLNSKLIIDDGEIQIGKIVEPKITVIKADEWIDHLILHVLATDGRYMELEFCFSFTQKDSDETISHTIDAHDTSFVTGSELFPISVDIWNIHRGEEFDEEDEIFEYGGNKFVNKGEADFATVLDFRE